MAKKTRKIKNENRPTLFQVLMGSIWRQSVDAAEQSALTLVNLPRFKSDLLKSNEEIAPQSREILQTFVWWGWGAGEGRVGHANLQRITT